MPPGPPVFFHQHRQRVGSPLVPGLSRVQGDLEGRLGPLVVHQPVPVQIDRRVVVHGLEIDPRPAGRARRQRAEFRPEPGEPPAVPRRRSSPGAASRHPERSSPGAAMVPASASPASLILTRHASTVFPWGNGTSPSALPRKKRQPSSMSSLVLMAGVRRTGKDRQKGGTETRQHQPRPESPRTTSLHFHRLPAEAIWVRAAVRRKRVSGQPSPA